MILVVFYHSIAFWTGNWFTGKPVFSSDILKYIAGWLNSFHIYGFTLVSGYLFYYLKYERGKYQELIPFVQNKVKRLIIPYVFTSFIWVIPISLFYYDWDINTIVNKFVLATSPSQLWFLFMLFDVFIIVWILSGVFAKYDFVGLLIVGGFYGLSFIGGNIFINAFCIWTACKYIIFFWIGFEIRKHGSNIINKVPAIIYIVIDILLYASVNWISEISGMVFTLLNLLLSLALNVIGAIMVFVILQKIAGCVRWKNSRGFTLLKKVSMPVYLFHQQVIYFFVYLLNGHLNPYIHTVINFGGAMIVSIIISCILLKFKWTRYLVGAK
jgi:hypothetical protein